MASLDYRLNPLFTIKECSSCGALYTTDFCCSKGGFEDKILVPKTPYSSQRPPQNCATCGDPVDGLYCRPCAFVRKCLNEGWYTIHDENEILNTFESSNDNTNIVSAPQEPFVFNQDPGKRSSQSPPHIDHNCCYECGDSLDDIFCQRCTCKSCGKGAHYGYNCPPQIPIISNPEPCYNQNLNEILQNLQSLQQQCLLDCGGPHETFQCQPMNKDYYHEQNSCYDSNSFGFDQTQPPQYTVNHPIFNVQNDLLNSQNKLMEQMTSICDMVGQIMQKKEEERRIAEDQVAKDQYWKIPICYDDDEDYTIAITPVLLTEEPVNSLSMGDEHLDTIHETESNEVIKSSVENLVPIPSESEGISNDTCDVPVCEDPSTFDALKDHYEILSDSNDDGTSSYDNDFKDIEYMSLEEVNDVNQEKKEFNLEVILEIQDVILREKLLNINRLIANIKSLNDNPTPNRMLNSPSPIPVADSDSFFEESDTSLSYSDNSLPEFESFSDHTEETRSGLTNVVISDNSNEPLLELPQFESFHFDPLFPRPPPEPSDIEISLNFEPDAPVINNFYELNEDKCFDLGGGKYGGATDMSVRWWQAEVSVEVRGYCFQVAAGQIRAVDRSIWSFNVSSRGGVVVSLRGRVRVPCQSADSQY
ncbi:hypothetical protein Tco_0690788 [Tanacetum coccineum]